MEFRNYIKMILENMENDTLNVYNKNPKGYPESLFFKTCELSQKLTRFLNS